MDGDGAGGRGGERAAVLGDLVARERRSDRPALRSPRADYDHHHLATTCWKVGNLLRHHGVRRGATVALADDADARAVLALFGAALLGAVVRVDPPAPVEAKALVAPTDRLDAFEAGPGTRQIGYGDRPAEPSVVHFERDVPGENPTEPPDRVDPTDPALATGERSYDHAALLEAARSVAAGWELGPGESVAVRASLADPGTVAAGVVAPLLADAVVLFPGADETADCAVADGAAPESRVVSPAGVIE